VRTARGGIVIQPGDFNPERVILDAEARGSTTVLTADPIDAATIATPATTARILSASTPRW